MAKIRLTFKTPDVMDVVDEEFEKDEDGNLTDEEVQARDFILKYVEYGEYLRVEFDTETETVTVLEK